MTLARGYCLSLMIVGVLFATAMIDGCGTEPTVNVSDFAVYTSLHLVAEEVAQTQPTTQRNSLRPLVSQDMYRYFRSTPQDYAHSQERMDQLLDGTQQRSSFAQALQTSLELNLAANLVSASTQPGASQPATTQMVAATTEALDAFSKYSENTTQPIVDSPFDQLDRASDFYTDYAIKILRRRGDSRAIDPKTLKGFIERFLAQQSTADAQAFDEAAAKADGLKPQAQQDRLLILSFQTHVLSGSQANEMTGIRIHIVGGYGTNGPYPADAIKVIGLHPSRAYDLDASSFDQSEQTALSIAAQLSGKAGLASIEGSGAYAGTEANQELEEYSSRIGKDASFADASQHMFGFNFYPSNVVVHQRFFLWQFLTGRKFQADGFLEAGGRDCAAIVMVPRDLNSFTCAVTYVRGQIGNNESGMAGIGDPFQYAAKSYYLNKEGVETELDEHANPHWEDDCEQFTVTLPKWNSLEELASTFQAAPYTTNPTTAPSTGEPSAQPTVTSVQPSQIMLPTTCPETLPIILEGTHLDGIDLPNVDIVSGGEKAGSPKFIGGNVISVPVTLTASDNPSPIIFALPCKKAGSSIFTQPITPISGSLPEVAQIVPQSAELENNPQGGYTPLDCDIAILGDHLNLIDLNNIVPTTQPSAPLPASDVKLLGTNAIALHMTVTAPIPSLAFQLSYANGKRSIFTPPISITGKPAATTQPATPNSLSLAGNGVDMEMSLKTAATTQPVASGAGATNPHSP